MSIFLESKRVLILGGTGFIGRHLAIILLKYGADVTIAGMQDCKWHGQFGFSYIQVDIINGSTLAEIASVSYHYVFNLSGYVDHTPYFSGGRQVITNHFFGLLNVLDCLDRSELKGFVQAGSSDEYGNQLAPQHELLRESPISPYSAAKVSATHLIQMLSKTEAFPGVVLRFFLVYGPGQDEKRFLPQIIKGCLENKTFPTSAGEQLRDFCYIDDVVEAMLLAAQSQAAHGHVINIASGQPVCIRDVIETIQEKVGHGNPLFGQYPYRNGENMALYADVAKAKQLLGWQPKVSFDAGIDQCIDYMKNELTHQEKSIL